MDIERLKKHRKAIAVAAILIVIFVAFRVYGCYQNRIGQVSVRDIDSPYMVCTFSNHSGDYDALVEAGLNDNLEDNKWIAKYITESIESDTHQYFTEYIGDCLEQQGSKYSIRPGYDYVSDSNTITKTDPDKLTFTVTADASVEYTVGEDGTIYDYLDFSYTLSVISRPEKKVALYNFEFGQIHGSHELLEEMYSSPSPRSDSTSEKPSESSTSENASEKPSGSSDLKFSLYDEGSGNTWYVYDDGSREYTDGYGNVVRDSDGDGEIDMVSVDGGETWFDY